MNTISTPKWSVETLQVYTEALRQADERFNAERDRRYAEVNTEREKAIKIKESANQEALLLAREIQQYKDEKANQLREQINSERGLYASKDDLNSAIREINAIMAPVLAYVSSNQATGQAYKQGFSWITTLAVAVSAIIGAVLAILVKQ